jgi:hypothetical protein
MLEPSVSSILAGQRTYWLDLVVLSTHALGDVAVHLVHQIEEQYHNRNTVGFDADARFVCLLLLSFICFV